MRQTGLYYYGFRYYAAWLCRFVSVDPLQFDYPYYTPFQYAGNKPITYIDLDGLEEALTPYMARVEYVETKNIFDASHNIMALLSNALIVGTYNASSGIINAVYNYEETGKAIANSRVGEFFKTGYNSGLGYAVNVAYDDIGDFANQVIKNTTWEGTINAFTSWENYEAVVDLAVGAKFSSGAKTVGKEVLTSEKSVVNFIDDIPVKKRLPKTKGKWIEGTRGEGIWKSEIDAVNKISNGEGIPFKDGLPDFSKWDLGKIEIDGMTGTKKDFSLAHKKMMREYGFKTQKQVEDWLKEEGLTLHHMEDGIHLQLVPSDLHNNIPHIGGASMLRNNQ